ncbi:hypothetical protein ScPMuIL_010686 [Solemya velum]
MSANPQTRQAIDKATQLLADGPLLADEDISDKCFNDTMLMLESLVENQPWALKMVDAMGKPPSGIMELKLVWLGDYDECLRVTAVLSEMVDDKPRETHPFTGQYCTATFPIGNTTDTSNPLMFMGMALRIGICAPSTCSSDDITQLIQKGISLIPIELNVTAPAVACQKKELEWEADAIAVLVVLGLFIALMVCGTFYDVVCVQIPKSRHLSAKEHFRTGTEKEPLLDVSAEVPREPGFYMHLLINVNVVSTGTGGKLLLTFSIYTNGSKILSTEQGAGTLTAVNGIRVISMFWVVLGHGFIFGSASYENFVSYLMESLHYWAFQAIPQATVAVDTFFLLSGLLMSYLILKEMKKNSGKINWPMFYFHRFWRLTPPYMLVMMAYVPLFKHFSDGPLWPQDGIDIHCKDNWWTNLLYINNIVHDDKMCIAWSWYLANDMQFYIVSPLMFVPLYYSGLLGGISCTLFMLANMISVGVISNVNHLPPTFVGGAQDTNNADFSSLYYFKPWCRIGPYVIGVLAGYLLYRTQCRLKIHWALNILGWCTAIGSGMAVVYGLYDAVNGHPLNNDTSAFFNVVHRNVWAIGVAWVIVACATGNGGFINTFLSWKGWIPIGRLTYCTYLVHPVIMYVYFYHKRTLLYLTDMDVAFLFMGQLLIGYAAGFVVSLAFEAPMMGLEKVIFRREKKS